MESKNQSYYRKTRKMVIEKLGHKCGCCGSFDNLHIHHAERTYITRYKNRGRGRLDRLTDWKRNMSKLELLCEKCHIKETNNCEHILEKIEFVKYRCVSCGKFVK